MRLSLAVPCLLLAALAQGRQGAPGAADAQNASGSLFTSTRIDAAIVVNKHPLGTDMVQVTVLKSSYSPDLLRKQIDFLAAELHSNPRALQVYASDLSPGDPGTKMVKASFGIDGLIDRQAGVLHVQPLARAFSLASSTDRLEAFMVQFDGESPTTHTLKKCAPPYCSGAEVEGRTSTAGPNLGIEYRVKLLTHDPAQITIPDSPADAKRPKPAPPKAAGPDWTLIVLLVVAAAAVGALVYSLLLRGRPRVRA